MQKNEFALFLIRLFIWFIRVLNIRNKADSVSLILHNLIEHWKAKIWLNSQYICAWINKPGCQKKKKKRGAARRPLLLQLEHIVKMAFYLLPTSPGNLWYI